VLRPAPLLGRLMRTTSTFTLMVILVLVVLQLSRMDTRFDLAMPEFGLPEQVVEGGETRVARAPDGHYWLRAEINWPSGELPRRHRRDADRGVERDCDRGRP
jgi:aspartyl protease family protein